MDNSLLSLKICLAVLLVLVLVQHFPAVQSHGTGRHGKLKTNFVKLYYVTKLSARNFAGQCNFWSKTISKLLFF